MRIIINREEIDEINNEDIKAMVLNENEGIDMSFEEVSNISSTLKSVEDDDLILPPESPTEEE